MARRLTLHWEERRDRVGLCDLCGAVEAWAGRVEIEDSYGVRERCLCERCWLEVWTLSERLAGRVQPPD
jgi:hypothetical protein